MIIEWFNRDLDDLFARNNRVVVVDPSEQARFLIENEHVKNNNAIYIAVGKNDVDELKIKYDLEKYHIGDSAVIYTNRKKDELRFIRDYSETQGFIDLSNIGSYITGKLHKELGENVNMPEADLLILAKKSVGKDENWWRKMVRQLDEVFEADEIIEFLNDPEHYSQALDVDVRELFYKKINELVGQPVLDKPAKLLADELVTHIFRSLADNSINKELFEIYRRWADSGTCCGSLKRYVHDFKTSSDGKCWEAHPDHCFPDVDRKCLIDISKNLTNKDYLKDRVQYIKKRTSGKVTWCFPAWWSEILSLVSFDAKKIDTLKNIKEVIEYYSSEFYKIDRAIRIIYAEFLNEQDIIKPFQQYYEQLNHLFLDKWFQYFIKYKETQNGCLKNIIMESSLKTAIIVGDGIRLEIAKGIADKLKGYYILEDGLIMAGIPSETENNMSALYLDNGLIESSHKKREDALTNSTHKIIQFMELDDVNWGLTSDYIILTCRDIDSLGEKLQQNALKMFGELEDSIAEKIKLLFQIGYNNVYLTSDHGFVLTGLLSESDKIEVNFTGEVEKNERYIRSIDKQTAVDNLIEIKKAYGPYQYIYCTKGHRPFKTPGKYGYSHGGITPQELIVPCFHITSAGGHAEKLSITIQNKDELQAVVGNNFRVKLTAVSAGNMFAQNRKIQLIIIKDAKEFKRSDVFSISAGDSVNPEYDIQISDSLSVILIDAESKEQLDKADIKTNKARDLGGLL